MATFIERSLEFGLLERSLGRQDAYPCFSCKVSIAHYTTPLWNTRSPKRKCRTGTKRTQSVPEGSLLRMLLPSYTA